MDSPAVWPLPVSALENGFLLGVLVRPSTFCLNHMDKPSANKSPYDHTFPVAFAFSAFLTVIGIPGQITRASFSAAKHFPTQTPQRCPSGSFPVLEPSAPSFHQLSIHKYAIWWQGKTPSGCFCWLKSTAKIEVMLDVPHASKETY